MERSRTQRLFAIPVALALAAYLLYMGSALFCYEPMVFAMQQADQQWAVAQDDCLQIAKAAPSLVKAAEAEPGFAQTVASQFSAKATKFLDADLPELQAPPNPVLFVSAEKIQNELLATLQQFIAAAQGHPKLLANPEFVAIAAQPGKIATARTVFNQKAAAYNRKIHQFPNWLLINAFGFYPKSLFTAPAQ
jgi:hypothetical protein